MAAKLADIEGLPFWPRLLSREQAAAYLGVTVPTLEGLPIASIRVRRRRLYDRAILDRWVDGLTGLGGGSDFDDDRLLEALD